MDNAKKQMIFLLLLISFPVFMFGWAVWSGQFVPSMQSGGVVTSVHRYPQMTIVFPTSITNDVTGLIHPIETDGPYSNMFFVFPDGAWNPRNLEDVISSGNYEKTGRNQWSFNGSNVGFFESFHVRRSFRRNHLVMDVVINGEIYHFEGRVGGGTLSTVFFE